MKQNSTICWLEQEKHKVVTPGNVRTKSSPTEKQCRRSKALPRKEFTHKHVFLKMWIRAQISRSRLVSAEVNQQIISKSGAALKAGRVVQSLCSEGGVCVRVSQSNTSDWQLRHDADCGDQKVEPSSTLGFWTSLRRRFWPDALTTPSERGGLGWGAPSENNRELLGFVLNTASKTLQCSWTAQISGLTSCSSTQNSFQLAVLKKLLSIP